MPWFYDSYSGKLVHEDPPSPGYYAYLGETKLGVGWHELGVADSATAAQAAAWVEANVKGGAAPAANGSVGQYASNAVGQGTSKVAQDATSALQGGLQLTFGNTTGMLGRTLKIGIGLILIVAGLAKITGATKVVTSAAKAAAL